MFNRLIIWSALWPAYSSDIIIFYTSTHSRILRMLWLVNYQYELFPHGLHAEHADAIKHVPFFLNFQMQWRQQCAHERDGKNNLCSDWWKPMNYLPMNCTTWSSFLEFSYIMNQLDYRNLHVNGIIDAWEKNIKELLTS